MRKEGLKSSPQSSSCLSLCRCFCLYTATCNIGVDSCSDGDCTCNEGYAGRDCCDCATGFYKDEDGEQCLGMAHGDDVDLY